MSHSPGLFASAIVTLPVKPVARLPYGSSAEIARPKSAPAVMLVGGETSTTNREAAAGATSIEPNVAGVRLPLVAAIAYPGAAVSSVSPENVTSPSRP